ncbi:hypothetical protein Vafri_5802 [Volvox africanus]|nr:hypothetical protein Vafri_5802 [Volvox africanus]
MSSFPLAANPAAASAAAPPNLVIGIDFGTYASGFAVYKRNPADASSLSCAESLARLRVSTHDRWPDQPTPDAKTRTALLYKGDKVAAWGWTAWKRWSEMSSEERRTHSYTYLENFKLLLEEGAAEGVDTVCSLPSGVTRVQAVADYLGEMRKYLRDHLRRTLGVTLRSDEVVWCLTVPAIWSDAAKARMREAAHRAGLCIQADSRSLLLTLEPEAAVLPTAEGNSLSDGDVVLVLDCGGGTADATLHCVRGSGKEVRLEEAAAGRGVLAGGAHVDSAAWGYIHQLLEPQTCDEWRVAHPDELTKTARKWELIKRSFAGVHLAIAAPTARFHVTDGTCTMISQQRRDVYLPLPIKLVEMLGKQKLQALSQPRHDRGWVGADQALVIPAEVVAQQIFDPVVNRIIELMHDVIEEGQWRRSNCNKVLLAGGFARSPYLQSRVRRSLPEHIKIILPEDPGAAVVTGAVVFGTQPSTVSARCARRGYGVGTCRPWTADHAIHNASFGFPKKFYDDEKSCYYADGIYSSFVKHGELIKVDQVVKHVFHPLSKSQDAITFNLYSTTSESARYTADKDMEKLAEIVLTLPSGWSDGLTDSGEYDIQAEMHFGATELSLVAIDKRSKNAVATTVAWLYSDLA